MGSTKRASQTHTKGPFGLRGEEWEVKKSKVELAENKLILSQIYSTLLYPSSFPLNPNEP